MTDQYRYKKKENIRIFIRRKRLSLGTLRKSTRRHINNVKQITSAIEKGLNIKKNKSKHHTIVVNYKPVFVQSSKEKFKTKNDKQLQTTNSNFDDKSTSNSKIIPTINEPEMPDAEDPLVFIEMMYQQLFTEDGQLRNGKEPTAFANCVKQIITHSRRNSMVQRDSISSNLFQTKFRPSISSSSSLNLISQTFSEEDENDQSDTLLKTNQSKRNSNQDLNAFLNSYYRNQQRSTPTNLNRLSTDDTDNEDLDTFSDVNSYRKIVRTSPRISIDGDITQTDSKLLSSSGYQSLKSSQRNLTQKSSKESIENLCSNCLHTPELNLIPASINIIQPLRDICT